MGLRIAHNIASLNAQRQLTRTDMSIQRSLERLSSGYKINRAGDAPAGLVNARRMSAQVAGLAQAIDNTDSAIAMVQTAEGALNEVHNILVNMRELALHAANAGANESAAIAADQDEISSAIATIGRIASSTQFGSKFLLNGTAENRASVVAGSVGIEQVSSSTLASGHHTVAVSNVTAASARHASTTAASSAGISATAGLTISGLDAGTHRVVITAATAAQIKSSQPLGTQTILAGGTFTLTNGSTSLAVSFASATANTAQNIVNEINADAGSSFTASVEADGSILIKTVGLGGANNVSIAVDGTSMTASMLGMSSLTGNGGATATAQLNSGATVLLNNAADAFTVTDGLGGQLVLTDTVTSQAGWASATLDVVVNPATFLVRVDNGATVSMTQGSKATATSGLPTGGSVSLLFNSSVAAGTATMNVVDGALQFQVGGFSGQTTKVSMREISPAKLGVGIANLSDFDNLSEVDVTSPQGASDAIKIIDAAIEEISSQRAELGSFQANVLESNQSYMRIAQENLTAAQSVLEDADFPTELSQFTRDQILLQTGVAMLAQANLLPQSVLSLLG